MRDDNPPLPRKRAKADYRRSLGDSPLSRMVASFDWPATGLGPLKTWPQSLRTTVDVALRSPVPIFILWGPDGVMIYNDAYAVFAGDRHPSLLGSNILEGWPEATGLNRDVIHKILEGETLSYKDHGLTVLRHGQAERVWVDLDYSPIVDESGQAAGVFAVVVETTKRVRAQQRQRQAEAGLAVEHEQLRALLRQAPAAIAVIKGPEHRFKLANKLYQKVFNRSEQQLLGRTVQEVYPELAGQGVYELFDQVYDTGESYSASEFPVSFDRGGDGKPVQAYFNFVAQPVRDAAGTVEGVLVHAVDVTDLVLSRKRAERSEERFNLIAKATSDAVWDWDLVTDELWWNDGFIKLFGYHKGDIEPGIESWYSRLHPDDKQKVIEGIHRVIDSGGTQWSDEYRFRRGDGNYASILDRGFILHDSGGKPYRMVGSMLDMTERKQAQQALRESEERFRVVSDNATTGLFVIDERQHCTFMNPAAEAITGYTLAAIRKMDKPLHDIIHHARPDGSPLPLDDCPIDRAMPKHGKAHGEDVFVRPDGRHYPVAFTASPIIKAGRPIGTVIEVHDISEEKRAERELRKLISVTEQRNALLKINKTKDEFISLASHQLRTPATAVKQYVALLLNDFAGPLSIEQRRYLKTAYDSNERELGIINDLLKTAQIDSSKYHLDKQRHDLVALLGECIADLKPAFEPRRQAVAFVHPARPVEAPVDLTELKLVFINLLENAGKYSHAGNSIEVTISQNDSEAIVTVADHGVGIAKSDQRRIFGKFTRVDNELSDTVTGTGLGLYWVKHIVELHRGDVMLRSAPGKGSAFTVRLPR